MTILGAMKLQLANHQSEMIYGSQLELLDVMELVAVLKSKTIQDRKKLLVCHPIELTSFFLRNDCSSHHEKVRYEFCHHQ
jgi:hypothetical protein